ncbi:MAG: error-prone DNA polymerase [Betaproteobacteria bacterium]|nr:MAG: error-prone DNA polymerase [Betaproteobacteria bacterium]
MVSARRFRLKSVYSPLPAYAELHCLSNFTFLRGASHPEELVKRAAGLGYSALAVTDECSLAGAVRAHVAAKDVGLPLIIGSEIRLQDGPRLVLLATDREGYGNLSELITRGRRRAKKGGYSLCRGDLDGGLPGCLVLLVPHGKHDAEHARCVAERFADRAWIAAELLQGPDDRAQLAALRELGKTYGLPLVASGDVHMHLRSRRPLQDTLTAIRLRKTVRASGHALFPNAERHLRLRMRLAQIYPAELLTETARIAGRCRFSLEELRYEYPEELVPEGETPTSWLRKLAEEGLQRRFPAGASQKIHDLMERELSLIAELRYEPFFLTVHDIVRYARSQRILCQGRGSAANSAVCYALGITEVNPAKQELLFERFISKERNEPPDIDVDFEHQRREEVIQYVYDKYGRERAALAATLITYQPKSALRDVGKALGLDALQVDRIAKSIAWWDDRRELATRLRDAGFDPESPVMLRLVGLASALLGFPRHLSQHVGGFVISRGALARLVPIENAAMPERSVIQWDKDDLENLGLLKVDVLALGMLSAIRRALDFVNELHGSAITMDSLLREEDPAVYEMMQHADTIGVFQIESRAQMSMLPRLKPKHFYDLVIEIAIVRPGPIQGDMVHPYLRRRAGTDPIDYPNEAVRKVLERTCGVPIFQEQVMQLAVVAAGFTPGEADQLRRAMAAWRRKGGLEPFHKKLMDGMRKNGISAEFAERIYRQILGFGEYGFPESHSVSFALLAYVSAWLKRHEPAAFLAALLNSQPMGFYTPSQLVQDARRHGVEVRPVDALASEWDCTLETGADARIAVRLGFLLVQGLSREGAERVVGARRDRLFDSVEDLARRAELNRHDLKCLAATGAFEPLSGHRRHAFWQVAGIETGAHILRDAPVAETPAVFSPPTEGENLVADYASTGLTLGRHPLALLRAHLSRMRFATADALKLLPGGTRARAAGIVTGRQRPSTASGTVFVTLEDETGYVNVIVWPHLIERQRRELLGARLMGVEGVLEREGEVMHLVARRLTDHSALLGELVTLSRDFH